MAEITYEDIKREFSPEDLRAYDILCKEFVRLAGGKNNAELWELVQTESALRIVLDTIHKLRARYEFLKGDVFWGVWSFDPNSGDRKELTW